MNWYSRTALMGCLLAAASADRSYAQLTGGGGGVATPGVGTGITGGGAGIGGGAGGIQGGFGGGQTFGGGAGGQGGFTGGQGGAFTGGQGQGGGFTGAGGTGFLGNLAGGAGGGAINASNVISPYFGNPLLVAGTGAATNSAFGSGAGGFGNSGFGITQSGGPTLVGTFGEPLYDVTAFGTATGTTGGLAARGGATGVGTGLGGTAQIGSNNIGNQGNQQRPAFAYTAKLAFEPRPVDTMALQSKLQSMVFGSSRLSNPQAIQVRMDGRNVVLEGQVQDRDEARLVEGMIRLTPGVRQITNRLTYPTP